MADNNGSWSVTPQYISSVVAVIGLITAFFWAVSDFRVTMSDMSVRMTAIALRITELDKRVTDLDIGGSRKLMVTENTIKQFENKVTELEETTHDLSRALLQHNEAMMDLYRKDMTDGKRDFKIPPNAPKYH